MKRKMSVLDIAPRIAVKRERQQFDAEFFTIASQIPLKVLRAIVDAVVAESPAPLERLPEPWARKALATWRKIMTTENPSATVLRLPANPASQTS
jgi:hypothetical protein